AGHRHRELVRVVALDERPPCARDIDRHAGGAGARRRIVAFDGSRHLMEHRSVVPRTAVGPRRFAQIPDWLTLIAGVVLAGALVRYAMVNHLGADRRWRAIRRQFAVLAAVAVCS